MKPRLSPTVLSPALGIVLIASLLISACSSSTDHGSSKASKGSSIVIKQSNRSNDEALRHVHEANICSDEVMHSHLKNTVGHGHSYVCEAVLPTEEVISNAHSHKVTKLSRSTRHIHPNGANKHTHHR